MKQQLFEASLKHEAKERLGMPDAVADRFAKSFGAEFIDQQSGSLDSMVEAALAQSEEAVGGAA